MKNVREFNGAKYNTLTKDEWSELIGLVNRICDAHEDEEWWKTDACIRTCVDSALLTREADENYSLFCEECECKTAVKAAGERMNDELEQETH